MNYRTERTMPSICKTIAAFALAIAVAFAFQAVCTTKAYANETIDKAVAAANALPKVSNLKWTDYTKVAKAHKVIYNQDMIDYAQSSDITEEEASAALEAMKTFDAAHSKVQSLVKAERTKAAKAKVKGVKVKAAKKKATVTWTKNTGKNKYEVYYSLKKGKGYKKAGTTTKNKLVIKKLKKGKKYFVKVRAIRTDIPDGESAFQMWDIENVTGKYSAVVKSKKIK